MTDIVSSVSIENMDGTQTIISKEDTVWEVKVEGRRRLSIAAVPGALSGDKGWIILETQIKFVPDNEWEEEGEWVPGERHIFARGVQAVLVTKERRTVQ